MMIITVNDTQYDLSTKLRVAKRIEDAFKIPLNQLFPNLGTAEVGELVKIVVIAADKTNDAAFADAIYDAWDYTDLYMVVQELVAKLMFSGTPAETAVKLAKFPAPEAVKNQLRELLGLPPQPPAVPAVPAEESTGQI